MVTLPSRGFAPDAKALAAELRFLADRIESGDEDSVKVVIASESAAGHVTAYCYGGPTTNAHAAGLLLAAQLKVLT